MTKWNVTFWMGPWNRKRPLKTRKSGKIDWFWLINFHKCTIIIYDAKNKHVDAGYLGILLSLQLWIKATILLKWKLFTENRNKTKQTKTESGSCHFASIILEVIWRDAGVGLFSLTVTPTLEKKKKPKNKWRVSPVVRQLILCTDLC